jgi:hypothetical protein
MKTPNLFPDAPLRPGRSAVERSASAAGGVVLREVRCRTILNRTSISDYSLNCYTGCEHGCIYCYARFMQRFHPHPEPWGKFVDVKVNAVQVLERQLRRATPGAVFVSSACDGWQPIEAERKLTRGCCELLERYSGMLFDGGSRDGYLSEIRKRVASAAKRFGLTERVAGCP